MNRIFPLFMFQPIQVVKSIDPLHEGIKAFSALNYFLEIWKNIEIWEEKSILSKDQGKEEEGGKI